MHQLVGAIQVADRLLHDRPAALRIDKGALQDDRAVIRRGEQRPHVRQVDDQPPARSEPLPAAPQGRNLFFLGAQVHEGMVRDRDQGEAFLQRDAQHIAFEHGHAILQGGQLLQAAASAGQHLRRGLKAPDMVALPGQVEEHAPGAAAHIQYRPAGFGGHFRVER